MINFKRGIDPKEIMSIGIDPADFIAEKINEALPFDEKYKYYTYKHSEERLLVSHFWLYEYVGHHFSIHRSAASLTDEGPEKFRNYYIQDYSLEHTTKIPAYDFLISMGILL